MNKKAFTLIELLVVVLIIGILAAIALPQYQKAVMKARYVQFKTMATALANAQEVYYLANNKYANRFDDLDINTPAYTQETTSATGATRTFPWGVCGIADKDNQYGARVSCSNEQDKIGHFIWLKYSSAAAGKVRCRAGTTDLTAPQNQICKAETGKTSGTSDGANALYWDY